MGLIPVNGFRDMSPKLRRPARQREGWRNVLSSTSFRRGIQSESVHGPKLHKSHSESRMRQAVIRLSNLANGLQKLEDGIWKLVVGLQKLDDALQK
jgi:X-X-X-Leu-X-X-Gly heptad repeat protein